MNGRVVIEVAQEVREKIIKVFGVTGKTVSNALNYSGGTRSESDLAKRIRRMAMQNGGRRMVYWPECETIHDEANGMMVQTFDNGAKLVFDKKTGYTTLIRPDGSEDLGWSDTKVCQIQTLQEMAAAL